MTHSHDPFSESEDASPARTGRLTRRATIRHSGATPPRRQIRRATPADLPAVLRLFDEAVEWLVARGIPDQWGTEPVSQRAKAVEKIALLLENGMVAERVGPGAGEIDGFVSVDLNAPPYLGDDSMTDSAYMHALVTRRAAEARGLGASLLRWAEGYAAEHGRAHLRTDCYADNPRLVDYYGGQGFVPCGEFSVAGQRGRFLKKPLKTAPGLLRSEDTAATFSGEAESVAEAPKRAARGRTVSGPAASTGTGRRRSRSARPLSYLAGGFGPASLRLAQSPPRMGGFRRMSAGHVSY